MAVAVAWVSLVSGSNCLSAWLKWARSIHLSWSRTGKVPERKTEEAWLFLDKLQGEKIIIYGLKLWRRK